MLPRTGQALRARARDSDRQKQQEEQQALLAQQQAQFAMLTPQQQQAIRMQQIALQRQQQQQHAQQVQQQMAASNRPRDRLSNLITAQEMDDAIVKTQDKGAKFRFMFLCFMGVLISLLCLLKYDIEYGIEVPLIHTDGGLVVENTDYNRMKQNEDGPAASRDDASSNAAAATKEPVVIPMPEGGLAVNDDEEVKAAYAELGVSTDDVDSSLPSGAEKVEDPIAKAARIKRMDDWMKKNKAKEAYEKHQEEYTGGLVVCGKSCEEAHKRKESAYMALSSRVNRDLYDVLGFNDANGAKKGEQVKARKGYITDDELKAQYEKKLEEIINATDDEEYKKMQKEELQVAYINLVDGDSRRYYNLYGRLAPVSIRRSSAWRDAGWGGELALRTFKNKLILAWLAHFDSAYADVGVLVFIGVVGFVVPALLQLPKIIDMAYEIERRQDEMAAMEKAAEARRGARS